MSIQALLLQQSALMSSMAGGANWSWQLAPAYIEQSKKLSAYSFHIPASGLVECQAV
jgi:hypothetical protein